MSTIISIPSIESTMDISTDYSEFKYSNGCGDRL